MNPQFWLNRRIDRRRFVGWSAGMPWILGASADAADRAQDDGLIERVRDPQNLEFPFHTL